MHKTVLNLPLNASIKYLAILLVLGLCFNGCKKTKENIAQKTAKEKEIKCSENGCEGSYQGEEFINGSDIAHQFSNKMSYAVGIKLKALYRSKTYRKVDFSKIKMTTEGMGSGNVIYKLTIPFIAVENKCEAYTSFDHVGGWNHSPALPERKLQLKKLLMPGHKLNISDLKTTPEGLQEYWIQWKHKKMQFDCKHKL